jgi:hypothetical protein
MPRYVPATSFTANRALTLLGVSYAKTATIPNSVIANIKDISALLSKGWIIPNRDPDQRRTQLGKPQPMTLGAEERRTLLNRTPLEK